MPRDADRRRLFTVCLPLFGPLAIADSVAGWVARSRGRILDAELSLTDTGSGGGSTSVEVQKEGSTIVSAAGLTIAQGATAHEIRTGPDAPVGEPSGTDFDIDETITVDVTAIPGGNAPAGGFVTLLCAAKDV